MPIQALHCRNVHEMIIFDHHRRLRVIVLTCGPEQRLADGHQAAEAEQRKVGQG
jgi:hypothetical protein